MSRLLPVPVLALLALSLPAATFAPRPAVAAVDGNTILRAADKRASAFEDQSYEAVMEVYKRGTKQKTLRFHMTMKGLDKQLIVFTAPGDVAGMKILMQDADTLYVYSPEFKKVRRIAAHMQNQGFLGSEFTYEDMTHTLLAPRFDAKFVGKKGSETTLVLTPKQGTHSTYAKLEVVIDARFGGVTKIRYFDTAGNVVREQIREDWKKVGGVPMPMRITMRNLKTGNETVIRLQNVRVNQGVTDELFSRRTLMRG
ncbi:MAG: outer membrane lipoprotein-sorting protein [Deltaproteobacteria bacterium]|nr:MAG: outer membrane lipoprotein-sorting protein [Deltaproteobacteria bacterium]